MSSSSADATATLYNASNYSAGLVGEIVLVTGASSGIGEETAKQFARAGAKVILAARRVGNLVRVKQSLIAEGVDPENLHLVELDVRDSQQVQANLSSLPDEFSAISVLVNNAGLALGKCSTQDNTDEMIDSMIDTNVKGALYVIRAVLPGMLERKKGHLINVSSIAGLEYYAGGAVYCASKAAFQAINNVLRKEVVATPLRVTSICPGMVETEFSLVRFKGNADIAKSVYKGLDPLIAADIADNILYVASRPRHVQIGQIVIFPTSQASTELIHREP
eukprot:CAMPEP_0184351202 /NCGR_PEP_ID=MMETSP1089-20130417/43474_1 /TAXON_ID=38269 ORGANISM="Gloeochaete wittrockiana, Strain SAG46.84" /NCGR_SAMPLE_ID=MMETSP1089 /ASSEMBLY_ACC=CAM_ASM_000445 /LENGTH=277 /DNA_ID=CAMNT_0026684491 /DNA_START=43 /DNA_END=876 /DNA_ORIENTATION=+